MEVLRLDQLVWKDNSKCLYRQKLSKRFLREIAPEGQLGDSRLELGNPNWAVVHPRKKLKVLSIKRPLEIRKSIEGKAI